MIRLANIRTSVGRTAVGPTALAVQSGLRGGHGIWDFDAFQFVFGKDSSCVKRVEIGRDSQPVYDFCFNAGGCEKL